jgi:hypothetical protein
MQKPYAPKCGQGKTKIDLFRDFLQKPPIQVQVMNFIPVKVSTLYINLEHSTHGVWFILILTLISNKYL